MKAGIVDLAEVHLMLWAHNSIRFLRGDGHAMRIHYISSSWLSTKGPTSVRQSISSLFEEMWLS